MPQFNTLSPSAATPSAGMSGSVPPPPATPWWIRLGLPAGCAILAAMLNYAAIKRQTEPIKAYALTGELPLGTLLQESHLTLVDLSGTFDRSSVVMENDLLVREGENGPLLSLASSLIRQPRILNHDARRGEILVHSSLGGIEGPRDEKERVIQVPREMIRATDDFLTPGKVIHFLVIKNSRSEGEENEKTIGPFRICFESPAPAEGNAARRRERDKVVHLAYGLDRDLRPSADAVALRQAIADSRSHTLFAEESRLTQSSKRPRASTTATTPSDLQAGNSPSALANPPQ